MTDLATLLDNLERQGVRFGLRDGRVVVTAPVGLLTPAIRATLAAGKATLLRYVQQAYLPRDEYRRAVAGDAAVEPPSRAPPPP